MMSKMGLVAAAGVVAVAMMANSAPAANATTNVYYGCSLTASTPYKAYNGSGVLELRGKASWSCPSGVKAPAFWRTIGVELQEYSSYFKTWFDVPNTEEVSSRKPWSDAGSVTTAIKCRKAQFRTSAQVEGLGLDGTSSIYTPTVHSASYTPSC